MSTAVAEKVDDDLCSAIGDPTRRPMLDLLLVEGDGTATTPSQQMQVTRQAVAKHLGVLDRVSLGSTGSPPPSTPGSGPTVDQQQQPALS